MPQIFFDTYAIIELIKGNKAYANYLDFTPVINDFVLAELCYCLLKDYGEEKMEEYFKKYSAAALRTSAKSINEAMKFRKQNSRKNLSMVDCIGYTHAKELKIKFLTGDQQFEKMENVEYVK